MGAKVGCAPNTGHAATRTKSTALTAGEAISETDRSLCSIRTVVPTYLLRDLRAINRTNP